MSNEYPKDQPWIDQIINHARRICVLAEETVKNAFNLRSSLIGVPPEKNEPEPLQCEPTNFQAAITQQFAAIEHYLIIIAEHITKLAE